MIRRANLILAYPGTGAGKLVKDLNGILLDWFGYRSDLSHPYSKWMISIPVLKSKLWDSEHLPDAADWKQHSNFIGWGENWKDIIRCFGTRKVSIHKISAQLYSKIVGQYRNDPHYAVDKVLISLDPNFRVEKPVSFYVNGYLTWLKAVDIYLSARQRDVTTD